MDWRARTASSPMTGAALHGRQVHLADGSETTPAMPPSCWKHSALFPRPWWAGAVVAWLLLTWRSPYPSHVASLVLAEPAVHLLTHPTRSTLEMTARLGFHRYVRRDATAAVLTNYRWAGGYKTGGNGFDAFPEEWREQMLAHASATLREMDQLMRPYPSRAAIRSIACPVTVIEGELSDPAFVAANAFVLRLLPRARMISLPGAAHMLHVDQPERWVEAVAGPTGLRQAG